MTVEWPKKKICDCLEKRGHPCICGAYYYNDAVDDFMKVIKGQSSHEIVGMGAMKVLDCIELQPQLIPLDRKEIEKALWSRYPDLQGLIHPISKFLYSTFGTSKEKLFPIDQELIKHYQSDESKEWMDAPMGKTEERDELEEAKNDMERIMANEFPARALLQYGYSKYPPQPNELMVDEIEVIMMNEWKKLEHRSKTFRPLAQAIHERIKEKK